MKTLILCLLFLVNSSIISSKTEGRLNKGTSPVNILKVDPSLSRIGWKVEKLTGSHSGTLKVFLGQLTVQRNKLTGGWILIDMNTINITDLTSPDKQKLEANLMGDNFFDTGRFTVARFDITNVNYADDKDDSQVIITGNLIMHGVTKKIDFKAAILKNNGTIFIARADLVINRRDWNIATKNFKYNTLIHQDITLYILLSASSLNA